MEFLAAEWQVPERDISLLAGAADGRKTLLPAGDAGRHLPTLERWLAGRLASRR